MALIKDHLTDPKESLLLSDLPRDVAATVQFVAPLNAGSTKNLMRRLAELGFLPGETVRVLRRVAGGEPIAVRIGSSTFALRKHEAECVTVFRQSALAT